MNNEAALDWRDVTAYSPVRVFLAGLWRFLFGGVFALSTYALLFAMIKISGQPPSSADPPRWLIALAPLVLGLIALLVMSSGLGRMASAFSTNCFFRAGREGSWVRLPRQGWFGRFRVASFRFKWSEIEKVVHFTYKTNGIPTSTELRIHLNDGTRLTVDRMYFSASVWSIQHQLVSIQTSFGR